MEQLVIAIRFYTKDTYMEIVDNIKNAGFKNVFIEWYDKDKELQNNILNYVKKSGLNIVFAHLGYENVNLLWEDNIKGEEECNNYINNIKICKENGIDLVVLHPTYTYSIPKISEIGITRMKKILNAAKLYDVKVAIENVETNGHLEAIFEKINNKNLGFCFDVGHCHLFSDDIINIELFKDKVYLIHLHDNFKEKDDHNLPFDGNVDWEKSLKQILKMNYKGYVIIESGYNSYYSNISLKEYYELAYNRGEKLIELFKLYKNN